MVNFILFIFSSILISSAQAAVTKLILTPEIVASRILSMGTKAQEINLESDLQRLTLAQALGKYDLTAIFETGYQKSKISSGGSLGGLATSSELDESYITTAGLKKILSTGTQTELQFARTNTRSDLVQPAAATARDQSTQMSMGLIVTQNLWKNMFGESERADLRAAEKTYKASRVGRASSLQNLVLDGLRAYWKAYVAQETLQDTLNSRDRYARLVDSVKKKSGFGYANSGELPQAQAEYEIRLQNVKTSSADYLAALDSLKTLLSIEASTEIVFNKIESIPLPPKLPEVSLETLRKIKAARLQKEAAEDAALASEKKNRADLSVVGKVYTSGNQELKEDAETEFFSGVKPRYYVGLKYEYTFGSGASDEEVLNKKLKTQLESAKLERLRLETADELVNLERQVQNKYNLAISAKNQFALREKAVAELTKTYTQGRTDISTLIEALNKQMSANSQMISAIGDYQIGLNQFAAARDELIPNSKAPGEAQLQNGLPEGENK